MPGCAVQTCKYGYSKSEEIKRQTFPFPNGALKEKWLDQIDRQDFVPGDHSRVCENHFQGTDFAPQRDSRGRELKKKVLKPGAYPTLYLHNTKTKTTIISSDSTEYLTGAISRSNYI